MTSSSPAHVPRNTEGCFASDKMSNIGSAEDKADLLRKDHISSSAATGQGEKNICFVLNIFFFLCLVCTMQYREQAFRLLCDYRLHYYYGLHFLLAIYILFKGALEKMLPGYYDVI